MGDEHPRQRTGQDDFENGGHAYLSIVEGLANVVGALGFDTYQEQLKSGEFLIQHLPKDGGPDWEDFIDQVLAESTTGNCLDVPLL